MATQIPTDVGSTVNASRTLDPQSISGSSDVNGVGVDRTAGQPADQDYHSGVIVVATGATTGTPTTATVAGRLQDSADNSSFADVSPSVTITSIVARTGGNDAPAVAQANFNAKGLRQYLRVVLTPTFVAGSSPTVLVSATLIMGGAQKLPPP
jgi:hypothetical protein